MECLWLVACAAVLSSASAQTEDAPACGLTKEGIELQHLGQVWEEAGEAKVLALVDLSVADANLLQRPLPDFCHHPNTHHKIRSYCGSLESGQAAFQALMDHSPIPERHKPSAATSSEPNGTIDGPARPKRQAVIVGLIAAGVLGFVVERMGGHPDLTDLREALVDLELDQTEQTTRVLEVRNRTLVLTHLALERSRTSAQLHSDVRYAQAFVHAEAQAAENVSALVQQYMALKQWEVEAEGLRDALAHHRLLAQRRFGGLVSGPAARLHPSVIPKPDLHAKLTDIQHQMEDDWGMRVTFGSDEAAYAATRVLFTDLHTVYEPKVGGGPKDFSSRIVASLVFTTPYFLRSGVPSQLYRLRSHAVPAADLRGPGPALPTADPFFKVALKAPYVAVKKTKKELISRHSYYQLLYPSQLFDGGDGRWINRAPAPFDSLADRPACEVAVLKGDGKAATPSCVAQAEPSSRPPPLTTLRSGCWLLLEDQAGAAVREVCTGRPPFPHPLPANKTRLFRPRCGCKYTSGSGGRLFPMSGAGCGEGVERWDVVEPGLAEADYRALLDRSREAYSAGKADGEEWNASLAVLRQSLDSAPSVAAAVEDVREATEDFRRRLSDVPRPLSWAEELGFTNPWEIYLFWAAVGLVALIVAVVALAGLVHCTRCSYSCYKAYRTRTAPKVMGYQAGKSSRTSSARSSPMPQRRKKSQRSSSVSINGGRGSRVSDRH